MSRYVPPKLWFLHGPRSLTSQRKTFFIVTAVKTSNLTETIFPVHVEWLAYNLNCFLSNAVIVSGTRGGDEVIME
jgi:hypothetical protein